MPEETKQALIKRQKQLGATGVAMVIVAILACELPIVLALMGLGGLATTVSIFSLSPIVKMAFVALGLIGLFLLIRFFMYRFSKVKSYK